MSLDKKLIKHFCIYLVFSLHFWKKSHLLFSIQILPNTVGCEVRIKTFMKPESIHHHPHVVFTRRTADILLVILKFCWYVCQKVYHNSKPFSKIIHKPDLVQSCRFKSSDGIFLTKYTLDAFSVKLTWNGIELPMD